MHETDCDKHHTPRCVDTEVADVLQHQKSPEPKQPKHIPKPHPLQGVDSAHVSTSQQVGSPRVGSVPRSYPGTCEDQSASPATDQTPCRPMDVPSVVEEDSRGTQGMRSAVERVSVGGTPAQHSNRPYSKYSTPTDAAPTELTVTVRTATPWTTPREVSTPHRTPGRSHSASNMSNDAATAPHVVHQSQACEGRSPSQEEQSPTAALTPAGNRRGMHDMHAAVPPMPSLYNTAAEDCVTSTDLGLDPAYDYVPYSPDTIRVVPLTEKTLDPQDATCARQIFNRQRQIDHGKKVTPGYANYIKHLTLSCRQLDNAFHPLTPRADHNCSKRKFDAIVSDWRRRLHDWDHVDKLMENPAKFLEDLHKHDEELEKQTRIRRLHRDADLTADNVLPRFMGSVSNGKTSVRSFIQAKCATWALQRRSHAPSRNTGRPPITPHATPKHSQYRTSPNRQQVPNTVVRNFNLSASTEQRCGTPHLPDNTGSFNASMCSMNRSVSTPTKTHSPYSPIF